MSHRGGNPIGSNLPIVEKLLNFLRLQALVQHRVNILWSVSERTCQIFKFPDIAAARNLLRFGDRETVGKAEKAPRKYAR